MNNLIAANLFRAKKTPLFWCSLVLCFAFGAYMSFNQWNEQRLFGFVTNLDSIFFGYTFSTALISAIFIPLFFGTEYSDGILRNRITTGSRRQDIYLANFISSFLFTLLTCAAYLAGCILVGWPLLGWLKLAPGLVLCFLGGSVLLMAAWCAIFTLITMNCRQKSAAIVICMLCLLVLFGAALMVEGRLEEPEMSTGYYLSIDGVIQPETAPNPRYLTGTARTVYEVISDLLPTGQSIQYAQLSAARPARLCLFAVLLAAAAVAAGAALFGRKDLN